MKKVLVLGATGAMGTYLVPLLLKKGYSVVGVSLDDVTSDHPNLRYIKADAKDPDFLKGLLSEGFDAVVDFMMYPTKEEFKEKADLFLPNTSHYIYLSTYRVYGESTPIREDSPRLLDLEKPEDFVSEREYSIYKAEGEEVLRASGYHNYTIVRPAITYSDRRFQLTTLEANILLPRMQSGKTVLLPEGAMDKQATMTWAGDVAKMLYAILFNPRAYGETYTVSTAEHHTWREVAEMYGRIGGLKYLAIPDDDFIALLKIDAIVKSGEKTARKRVADIAAARRESRLALMAEMEDFKEPYLHASHLRNQSVYMQIFADIEAYAKGCTDGDFALDVCDLRGIASGIMNILR